MYLTQNGQRISSDPFVW